MKNILMSLILTLVSVNLLAAEYPEKSVTLIVPYGAGGPMDGIARKFAIPLSKQLGQSVVVENRSSTGGIVGMEAVLNAKPDGYTLLINNNGMATVSISVPNLKFNPITDFTAIGALTENPMVLVGKTQLQSKSWNELQKYIVDNKQSVNVASGGVGTTSHLCALALKDQLNVDFEIIPYKGNAPALIDLQSGQVDLLCDHITVTYPHVVAGKIKAYGIAASKRNPLMPSVPTLHEQGLRGFDQQMWTALFVPKSTPNKIVERLNQAVQNALKDQDFQDSIKVLGATSVSSDRVTSTRVYQDLAAEQTKWLPLAEKDRLRNERK
jgi:tripartite-type tricarboxylate transporter receptor subunit TctC